jgi:hypothetical protein
MAGMYAFGHARVDELLATTSKRKKCLVFYYKTEYDLDCDILSYRFERIDFIKEA